MKKTGVFLLACLFIGMLAPNYRGNSLSIGGRRAFAESLAAPRFVPFYGIAYQKAIKEKTAREQETSHENNTVSVSSTIVKKTKAKPVPPKKTKKLLDARLISQNPQLPRGCEVTSLAMMLQSAGVNVDKMTLASKVKKVPFESNGLKGNPNDGFVGNMYTFSKPGLGVFHKPIADLARQYLGKRVVDLTGADWSTVQQQVDKGRPVWVVVTSRYRWLPSSYWRTWQTKSGEIRISYQEHAVLITGYDNSHVYFNDPLANIKNRQIDKTNFVAGWNQYGKQAVSYN